MNDIENKFLKARKKLSSIPMEDAFNENVVKVINYIHDQGFFPNEGLLLSEMVVDMFKIFIANEDKREKQESHNENILN